MTTVIIPCPRDGEWRSGRRGSLRGPAETRHGLLPGACGDLEVEEVLLVAAAELRSARPVRARMPVEPEIRVGDVAQAVVLEDVVPGARIHVAVDADVEVVVA